MPSDEYPFLPDFLKEVCEYITVTDKGAMAKCTIFLCNVDLILLERKHPEYHYVYWTKERERNGEFQKDIDAIPRWNE
jgi:hypothetical protein